ncbi:putative quinol monooxygenase [Peptostreptococcus stomatis]|uniref:Antibiotic biosynthesis monooxygenase n=1 Tax=Peptostreptococcus stomatis DSM 17678 TaxID=596315 RepID=E0E4S3_9FIRM|nr:antibiotic biosynthesis monooxygenase [Peptostreptococcus stomatis]EFM64143.1 antibiotic biosynthesis monooxygenase [Peptostreptococcus stomatis DSM 17678]
MLTVFVRVKVKPNFEDDYVAAAKALVKSSRKELENITYDFCRIDGSDHEYCFVERWESYSSLEKHQASQHYIDAKAVFEELVEDIQTTIGEMI